MAHSDDLKIIHKALDKIQDSETISKLCKKYKIDKNELYLVPICFKDDLEVSARTDHGIIYLNGRLRSSPEDVEHYLAHELTHYCQQCTGSKPTKGSDSGDYLDNKEEIEGFQHQVKYLADTKDEDEAEDYVDQVLDHHSVTDRKERDKRKKQLMQLAAKLV